jgi:hypothetical protein
MSEKVIETFEKLMDADVVLVKGPAGSGKTTLIKALVEEARRLKRDVQLMAPTGRAAKVLADRVNHPACTLHKALYGELEIQEHFDAAGDSSTYKWVFSQKSNPLPANSLLVVDEASMISDTFMEDERLRFGSGYLLKDLMRFANLKATNNTYQLILVGDPYQLPPVGSSNSPALDQAYLEKTYQLKVAEVELTTVFRQTKGSGILENAARLRSQIDEKRFNSFAFQYGPDMIRLEPSDFVSRYEACTGGRINPSVLVVAHSNKTVNTYNQWIRSLFFPGAPKLVAGDVLLITQNNYAPDPERPSEVLYNGEFTAVLEVYPGIERETGVLRRDGEMLSFVFEFQKVRIRVQQEEAKELVVRLLVNLLDSPEPTLTDDQKDALYVNFRFRNRHLKPGTGEFAEALRKDPYLNALRVKYGYAVTCHKAQGGEWQTVFVDYQYRGNLANDHFFRWAYTALTRARQTAFSLEAPSFTAISGCVTLTEGARLCERFADVKLLVLETLKKMGIEAACKASYSYHDFYTVNMAGTESRLRVTYDKQLEITDVLVECKDPARQAEMRHQLKLALLGRTADGFLEVETPQVALPEESRLSPHQRMLEENLLTAADLCGVTITERTFHSRYHLRYQFRKAGEFCEADYYSNEKGAITRIMQGKSSAQGVDLLRQLTLRYGESKE